MAFSSIPVYLNHPNWQQHQGQDNPLGSGNENPRIAPPGQVVAGGGGSTRPGSMVDRARLAKLPQPEAGLKCPRCDSTNTKFCYFNNYNFAQPRHFCKTCRRYWTRGGALRNVPVGGGCRRNKKNKGRITKASATSTEQRPRTTTGNSNSTNHHLNISQPTSGLSFMGGSENLSQYDGGNIGSNIVGFQPHGVDMGNSIQTDDHVGLVHVGNNNSIGNTNLLSSGGADQWRLSFLAGFEPCAAGFLSYQSEGSSLMVGESLKQLRSMSTSSRDVNNQHLDPSKLEENQQGLNLSRQFMSMSTENNHSQWGSENAVWTEFSGLNSSSTNNFL